jgi:hypothetical protein
MSQNWELKCDDVHLHRLPDALLNLAVMEQLLGKYHPLKQCNGCHLV